MTPKPRRVYIDFGEHFARLYMDIYNQQQHTLCWLAADPSMVAEFTRAGGKPWYFHEDEELNAIFVAVRYAHERKRDRTFAALSARFLLRHLRAWSESDDYGGGSFWTAMRLARMFDAAYPCASRVRHETVKLTRLMRRRRDAYAALGKATDLLTGDWEALRERAKARAA